MADQYHPCVFCQIVRGDVPSSRVYEDEGTLAFMNRRQYNPGHVLVIPKEHYATIYELDEPTSTHLFRTVVKVARAVQSCFAPDGLNISQSNGEAAGQEVFHVHIHILPRKNGDNLIGFYPQAPAIRDRGELDRLAELLRGELTYSD